jgi:hypothetical protein
MAAERQIQDPEGDKLLLFHVHHEPEDDIIAEKRCQSELSQPPAFEVINRTNDDNECALSDTATTSDGRTIRK